MKDFRQDPPELTQNQYEADAVLKHYLRHRLEASILSEIEPDLIQLGARVTEEILHWGRDAEANPPCHNPYDAWGKRTDEIVTSRGWKELDRIAAEEGLVAIGYERRHGWASRVHQFVKLYLYGPSSAIYTCPLAMTDGAARAIELHADDDLKARVLPHLTSRDPRTFWTSGQWMTEKTGGSDVTGTSTVAKKQKDSNLYTLHGVKWFTSATTSQMSMALARIEGQKALSLFYIELRDSSGELNGIRIHRLKDKLGTRALPTAELTLDGTVARLVGQPGEGVRRIASLFNITRIYNACAAVGLMRRGLALSLDYADKRIAFGKPIAEHPLHRALLRKAHQDFEGCFHLTFRLVELLGKVETSQATPEEQAVLRLFTPIAKLFTAKVAVHQLTELIESFGGAGYIEDTGIPSLLRDAHVLPIWEGTTNVLSLDMLRAVQRENALPGFVSHARSLLDRCASDRAASSKIASQHARISKALESSKDRFDEALQSKNGVEPHARRLAFELAEVFTATLILEQCCWELARKKEGKENRAGASLVTLDSWCARLDLQQKPLEPFERSAPLDSELFSEPS